MVDEDIENRWLERGHKFFRTLARNGFIRGALLDRGLSEAELRRGWDLFATVLGFSDDTKPPAQPAAAAASALAALDAWDAPNFSAAQATLEHRTPAAFRFLFEGLKASKGTEAVAGVQRFIERVTALRESTVPAVPSTEAATALQLLEQRKIFAPDIEARLRGWLELVQTGAPPLAPTLEEPAAGVAFSAFRNWLHEWREVARATFSRRDYLISLGLAERKSSAEAVSAAAPKSAT